MNAWMLFLPAALVVMGCAAYTLWPDGSHVEAWPQLRARARAACQLGSVSSVMLALAGLGCLGGPAGMLGWLMIVLGLLGVVAGAVVLRRYLATTSSSPSPESRWRRQPRRVGPRRGTARSGHDQPS
jgi:hypothetical protein